MILTRTVQEYIISQVAIEIYDPAERKLTFTGVQIQTKVPAAQISTILNSLVCSMLCIEVRMCIFAIYVRIRL